MYDTFYDWIEAWILRLSFIYGFSTCSTNSAQLEAPHLSPVKTNEGFICRHSNFFELKEKYMFSAVRKLTLLNYFLPAKNRRIRAKLKDIRLFN